MKAASLRYGAACGLRQLTVMDDLRRFAVRDGLVNGTERHRSTRHSLGTRGVFIHIRDLYEYVVVVFTAAVLDDDLVFGPFGYGEGVTADDG